MKMSKNISRLDSPLVWQRFSILSTIKLSTVAWGTFCEILIEIKRTLNNKFETQCQGPLVIWPMWN